MLRAWLKDVTFLVSTVIANKMRIICIFHHTELLAIEPLWI